MGNGVGPRWFPAWARRILTRFSARFFSEADWERHDEGYARGSPDRATCDRKFLKAMLRDAAQATTTIRVLACVGLALFFWTMVRAFGWTAYKRRHDVFTDQRNEQ